MTLGEALVEMLSLCTSFVRLYRKRRAGSGLSSPFPPSLCFSSSRAHVQVAFFCFLRRKSDLRRQADPSLVILLCGNKADMESQRQVPRELAEQYAKEEGLLFAEASAKSGQGVSEVFIELGDSLYDLFDGREGGRGGEEGRTRRR